MLGRKTLAMLGLLAFSAGCSSQNVPQAHKGRMFDKTGAVALWFGGAGFEGPVLSPGTYFTGCYPEVRMVDCAQRTIKEPMTALAKDNVQFSLDVFISFNANCETDDAVIALLNRLAPLGHADGVTAAPNTGAGGPVDDRDPVEEAPDLDITSRQVYNTFIRPAIGEAVRQTVSGYNANDINGNRDQLFRQITMKLDADLTPKDAKQPKLVIIDQLNLSNFDFPKVMEDANTDRATQAVLKDKSLAEQEVIRVETETAKLAVAKTEAEAEAEAAKIRTIGKALHENPEYYIRDVYFFAADKGGSIVLPQDPRLILNITPKRP